jgi:hypothetical protein
MGAPVQAITCTRCVIHSLQNTKALAFAWAFVLVLVLEQGRKVLSVPCGTVLSKTAWCLRRNVPVSPTQCGITFANRPAGRGDQP